MNKVKIVAELSINHLGMLNIAKAMVKAAKDSGADYIKFKKKDVVNYYSKGTRKWRQYYDFLDYRKSLELSLEDFQEIDTYCKGLDIPWFSTVHDAESLEVIKHFKPPFYKVASSDSDKENVLIPTAKLAHLDTKPLVVSVGGKSHQFVVELIDKIHKVFSGDLYLLHTVAIYPTPLNKVNLHKLIFLQSLKDKYENLYIGYSGHEVGFIPTLMTNYYNVDMIERHFTLSRDLLIHHIDTALLPNEFSDMVDNIRAIKNSESTTSGVIQGEDKFLQDKDYSYKET